LRSDHDLLQFMQQLFAISQRQSHSFVSATSFL
jgi:hypothetical protein